jgi:hypothetical protein
MSTDYEALDMSELQHEAKRVSDEGNTGGGDYLEKFVRLPERDGFSLLRFMPRKKGTPFFVVTRVHTLNNPVTRQKRTFHCPKTLVKTERGDKWQGDCIICKYYSDLWQKSEGATGKEQEDLQNKARAIKPVERYYYNVIVRSEKDKDGNVKKNVGPKIYSCGKTVHSKIIRAILGDPTAGEKPLGDVSNPTNGRDFRVVKKTVKGGGGAEYPNYDQSKFEDPSPIGSPDELEKWLENTHDLQALRVLKSPDELKHALRVHCGMVRDEASGDDELEEFRTATAAAMSTKPSAPVASVREDLAVSTQPAAKAPASSVDNAAAEDVLADDDFMSELSKM